jgi:hypothetical protein
MAYAFISQGLLTIADNVSMTPALPSGYVAGNLLILHAGEYLGTDDPPDLTGQGYTLLSTAAEGIGLYGCIAAGDAGDQPTFEFGGFWQYAQLFAYSGNPNTLTGIVNAESQREGTDDLGVYYSGATPTVNGCLGIAAGMRNKTTTVNGATFASMTNYTLRSGSPVASSSAECAPVYNDWIQTTATASPSMNQNLSIADSAQPQRGNVIFLLPGSGGGGGGGSSGNGGGLSMMGFG